MYFIRIQVSRNGIIRKRTNDFRTTSERQWQNTILF
jgi:hypothetical protein